MKTMSATEAKNRFGELLDSAQAGPVAIQKNGRDVAYVVSKADFAKRVGVDSDGVNPDVRKYMAESMERHEALYRKLAE